MVSTDPPLPSAAGLAPPAMRGEHTYASITDKISAIVLTRPTSWIWIAAFALCSALTLLFAVSIAYLLYKGVGIWGINIPIAWAFAISSYVWWIAIGMAGTFISAALALTRQDWGASINRFAEAMTIFAVSIAGIFPIIHLGRAWFFYWLTPYPNIMNVWPQWQSPLVWDFFAILAYLLLSLMFWYLGLIPDLATLRDRARKRYKQIIYGIFALGWRGDARHWQHHESAHLLLAGLAVPLVVSVHSVVGLDFAAGNTPGWHSAIFPPFFVAGALFSGFSMALTLAIVLRHAFDLRDFITARHLDNLAKIILATGLIVAYSYAMEIFTAFYSADRFAIYTVLNRFGGVYSPVYWTVIGCNVIVPQALWLRSVRNSPWVLLAITLVINVGMWGERFMLIVSSLQRDFLPSSWGLFHPTFWDWSTLAGSIGFFGWLFLLFVRFLPMLSIADMHEVVAKDQR